jgi:hypothetical protein
MPAIWIWPLIILLVAVFSTIYIIRSPASHRLPLSIATGGLLLFAILQSIIEPIPLNILAARTSWLPGHRVPGYPPHVALPFRNVGEKKEAEERDIFLVGYMECVRTHKQKELLKCAQAVINKP